MTFACDSSLGILSKHSRFEFKPSIKAFFTGLIRLMRSHYAEIGLVLIVNETCFSIKSAHIKRCILLIVIKRCLFL